MILGQTFGQELQGDERMQVDVLDLVPDAHTTCRRAFRECGSGKPTYQSQQCPTSGRPGRSRTNLCQRSHYLKRLSFAGYSRAAWQHRLPGEPATSRRKIRIDPNDLIDACELQHLLDLSC